MKLRDSERRPREVAFEPEAMEALEEVLPKRDALRVMTALDRVAADPFAANSKLRPLEGAVDTFRLRQGDWRVVYVLDRGRRKLLVVRVGHRREVYR